MTTFVKNKRIVIGLQYKTSCFNLKQTFWQNYCHWTSWYVIINFLSIHTWNKGKKELYYLKIGEISFQIGYDKYSCLIEKKTWEKTHQNFPHVREMRFQRHNGAQKVSLSNFSAPTISRDLFTDLYFDYIFKKITIMFPIYRLTWNSRRVTYLWVLTINGNLNENNIFAVLMLIT